MNQIVQKTNDLNWLIGGEAGVGIQSAGRIFAMTCSRAGLYVFCNSEYPSLIRGGHNSTLVRIADHEVSVHTDRIDMLLAMNFETLRLHAHALSSGGGIIYDGEVLKDYKPDKKLLDAGVRMFNVPLKKLALDSSGSDITRNTVGIAVSFALLGFPQEFLINVLKDEFKRKGDTVIQQNIAAAKSGYDYVLKNLRNNDDFNKDASGVESNIGNSSETMSEMSSVNLNSARAMSSDFFGFRLVPVQNQPSRMLISGNEVVCLAALKAGVKFVAEYPMTPSSTVLHFMATQAKNFNIFVKHTEDEIAAINMVVGAAWTGARAMTATSGGGFALMSEAVGMAGMLEAPVVINEVQRGGPSTGLPTRTEQSDLNFAIHSSHGEFPRFVVAPGDYRELFYKTFEAFNIADRFQMPAIIITDKHLGESLKNIEVFDTNELSIDRGKLISDDAELDKFLKNGYLTPDGGFLRYKFEDDGVSPRTIPGMRNGRHRASTDEHDESGDLTETPENRTAMHLKRMKKLEHCLVNLTPPKLVGPGFDGAFTSGAAFGQLDSPNDRSEPADLTFVTWGSPKDAVLETMQYLLKIGIRTNLLQIIYFVPFHTDEVREILKSAKFTIGVEMNQQAQMANYIKEKTGIELDANVLNWSGRQITPEEIFIKTQEILKSPEYLQRNI